MIENHRCHLLFLVLLVCNPLYPQTGSHNYVRSRHMLDDEGTRYTEIVDYRDGLGRPVERLTNSLSTDGSYACSAVVYDQLGRESVILLPGGGAQSADWMEYGDALALSRASHGGDNSPFTNNMYDGLGRLVTSIGPGQAWRQAQKPTQISHGHNTSSSVKRYAPESPAGSVLLQGYYPAGSLEVERVTDEDGHWVETYKDVSGLVVLVRRNGGNDTYTVYDGHGDVRFILTPMYQEEADLGLHAYEYRYDSHRRCVWKRLPGCEPVRYWYDGEDRVCYMDDDALRSSGRRRFFLYDRHNRLAVQGTVPADGVPELATVSYTGGASPTGICGTGYVLSGGLNDALLEEAHYYDNYRFLSESPTAGCTWRQYMTRSAPNPAKGLPTGSIGRNTDGTLSYEVVYYDEKGRRNDARETFPGGELLMTMSSLSFTGKPLVTTSILHHGNTADTLRVTTGYSQAGELPVSTDVSVDGCQARRVSSLTYDGIGRVSSLAYAGSIGTLSYVYNAREWLTEIQGGLFSERVWYNDAPGTHTFNGQVSAERSRIGISMPNGYKYAYDSLGRLTDAVYGEANNLSLGVGRYSEHSIAYNANGAVTALKRNGRLDNGSYGVVDDLAIDLDGDRPCTVEDAATELSYENSFDFHGGGDDEYVYDGDGRLTNDPNKGVAVTYDLTGTPRTVTLDDVRNTYTYSADGVKQRVVSRFYGHMAPLGLDAEPMGRGALEGGGLIDPGNHDFSVIRDTRYCGPFVLEDDTLSMVLFPGGFCTVSGGQPSFHYYVRDHRGDNRCVVSEDGAYEQKTFYYPLGGIIGDKSTAPSLQPYKRSGKEWDHLGGLDWYDYGARMYDPALGVWTSGDPLAEDNPHMSIYAFCGNDPVSNIDPDGRDYWSTNNKELIYSFWNAIGSGQTQYDFSGWQHYTDNDFTSILFYNDETKKYYISYAIIENGGITVIGRSFDANLTPVTRTGQGYLGAFVYKPLEGFWLKANHFLNGTTYNDGFTNWKVNLSGRIVGVAPITGTAPVPGKGKVVGGTQKMGRAIGKMSGNRVVQRKQVDALSKKHHLYPYERKILHDEISHQGLGYHEIEELIYELFGK